MKERLYEAFSLIYRAFIVLTVLCSSWNHYQISQQYEQKWLQLAEEDGAVLENVMRADACDKHRSYCLNNVLLIRGGIGLQTYFDLKRLYEQKRVLTICVDSPGGIGPIATLIAQWIHANKLNTCMAELYILHANSKQLADAECHSACPLVLAAGHKRWSLGENQIVGVHQARSEISWCFCQLTIPHSSSITSLLLFMPPSTASFDLLFAMSDKASPAQIYLLNPTELVRVNMFTDRIDRKNKISN